MAGGFAGAALGPVAEGRDLTVHQLGERHASNRRTLYVQKFLRKTTVRVTREPEVLRQEADRIEVRIQH